MLEADDNANGHWIFMDIWEKSLDGGLAYCRASTYTQQHNAARHNTTQHNTTQQSATQNNTT
jgi:hypothetical protein